LAAPYTESASFQALIIALGNAQARRAPFVAIAVIVSLTLGVAGCRQKASPKRSAPAKKNIVKAKKVPVKSPVAPRSRGTQLTIQLGRLPTHLNPLLPDADEWTYRIGKHHIFEPLTRIAEDGKVKLHLIESVEWKEDRRRLIMRLRKGMLFHDGRPMTARDAFYTLHHVLRLRSVNPLLRARLAHVRKVLELSKHVFELRLSRHDEQLLKTLADVVVLPAHRYRRSGIRSLRLNQTPVGSGPYRLVPSQNEGELRLERFDGYWGEKPALSAMVFRQIRDPAAALMALRNREVDMVPSVYVGYYPAQVQDRRFKQRFEVLRIYPRRLRVLLFNSNKRPFKDRRARQAVAHLVDRQRLVRAVRNDLATVVSGPMAPTSRWYDRTLHPRSLDRAKAGRLFDSAGWIRRRRGGRHWLGHPLRVRLVFVNDATARAIAESIAKDLKAGAVKVELSAQSLAQFSKSLARGRFDLAVFGLALDPSLDLAPFLHSKGKFNYGRFESSVVDGVFDGLRRLPPTTDRVRLGRRLHRALFEELPLLVLFQPIEAMAVNKRVKGLNHKGRFPLFMRLRVEAKRR
jgi:peptide/nickel transport system substrate-binding protein